MAQEALTAGEVAARIGVAVTTLRSWDRRYGLGPREHHPGKHRRYQPDDLLRLAEMQRLVAQGIPPARAAAWILDRAAPAGDRDGGGHAVAVGAAGPAVRGLTRAAMRLDAAQLQHLIAVTLADDGVMATWTQLLAPALIHIGAKHAATDTLVEVEHLLSHEISAGLARISRPSTPARILLACTDEEQHSLAVQALAAALAERGVASRLLGARVPPQALRDALRRTAPQTVLLWSQTPATAHPEQLHDAISAKPAPTLVLAAGPGWDEVDLPGSVGRPVSLAEALTLIVGAPTPTPRAGSPNQDQRDRPGR